ncbi:hypothetical protein LAZ67_3004988 [Cordylochernes scorpioides]|uniref:Uncharacterized protein n=1 Tax=Cordylochernes scorpioides TaxID=51811 RepID=A0ABY6KA68_9ARAC|nr:hypothetical protein LAZ67_3004988 [Cordylochernes scorpioides]
MFKCEYCNYETPVKNHLRRHMCTHTGEKTFKCEYCDYEAAQKKNLTYHLYTHTGEKPFKCEYCDYETAQKISLTNHLYTHTGGKPFKCEYCDYETAWKNNLTNHLYTHTGEKPFKCEYCDFRSSLKIGLKRHINTHTGEKPFKCEYCDYETAQKISLTNHLYTHTGDKPFKCEYCDFETARKDILTNHLNTHTGEKPFKCEYCDFRCSLRENIKIHINTHTGEKPFKCEYCDYETVRKKNLTSHLFTHTGDKPFKCEYCDYETARKRDLTRHSYTHTGEKPFNEICGKGKQRYAVLNEKVERWQDAQKAMLGKMENDMEMKFCGKRERIFLLDNGCVTSRLKQVKQMEGECPINAPSGNSTLGSLKIPIIKSVMMIYPVSIRTPAVQDLPIWRSRFIWPNMNKDIRKWAQACVNCQKCKVSIHTKSEIGKYQEVDERFRVVHIDLIGPLPPSNGNIYCLTCIDRYTSWMEVFPLPDMKSETVARAFYENWIVRFGTPHTVISDQGKQFTSQLFKDLTTLCGIKLRHSTAYHPQCNGKIERLHRTIKTAIHAHNNIKWTETLPTVLLGFRACVCYQQR